MIFSSQNHQAVLPFPSCSQSSVFSRQTQDISISLLLAPCLLDLWKVLLGLCVLVRCYWLHLRPLSKQRVRKALRILPLCSLMWCTVTILHLNYSVSLQIRRQSLCYCTIKMQMLRLSSRNVCARVTLHALRQSYLKEQHVVWCSLTPRYHLE